MSESIGIIAGSGQFPRLVAEDAKAAGYGVVVCAFHGFTDPGLEALADAYTTVYLGQFDKVIDYFRKHGVRRLCMAGAINKPRALDLRPDFRAARILFSLRGKGDDALLRAIMADLEKEGFTLIQAAELSTSLLCPEGVLTRRGPSAEEIAEIDYGWPIAEALGRFDIGQCIVVKQGMVVAVECLEGTDAALRRGGELRGDQTLQAQTGRTRGLAVHRAADRAPPHRTTLPLSCCGRGQNALFRQGRSAGPCRQA